MSSRFHSIEQYAQFAGEALAARADMQESGLGYEMDGVRSYLRERLFNEKAEKPAAKSWRECHSGADNPSA